MHDLVYLCSDAGSPPDTDPVLFGINNRDLSAKGLYGLFTGIVGCWYPQALRGLSSPFPPHGLFHVLPELIHGKAESVPDMFHIPHGLRRCHLNFPHGGSSARRCSLDPAYTDCRYRQRTVPHLA